MSETIKNYLKEHWISMAISLGTSGVVFLIALINIFVAFRLDYAALKSQVFSSNANYVESVKNQQSLIQKVTQIDQKVTDDHQSIQDINSNIQDLHRYFFDKK